MPHFVKLVPCCVYVLLFSTNNHQNIEFGDPPPPIHTEDPPLAPPLSPTTHVPTEISEIVVAPTSAKRSCILFLDHWKNDAKQAELRTTEILLQKFNKEQLFCINPDPSIVNCLQEGKSTVVGRFIRLNPSSAMMCGLCNSLSRRVDLTERLGAYLISPTYHPLTCVESLTPF